MFQLDDTIVAISTAAGDGGRAIVRVSGPDAVELTGRVFRPATGAIEEMGAFRAADGLVHLTATGIELPARAYVFRAPRSFTRQDVVELHVPAAPAALTSELIDLGARQAGPGEFTARAFFSGRIGLSAAEAVADVIDAADDAELRSAMAALGGRIERWCAEAASEIADVLAGVEASIDLAGEDITLDAPDDLAGRLDDLVRRLRTITDQAVPVAEGTGPTVVLAGRVNVGKSSLLNALSGTDRAIVSAVAGTTRDVLRATMATVSGRRVSLADAAGFAHPATPLDAAAHRAAHRAVAAADAIAFVVDATDDEHLDDDLTLLADARAANPRAPVLLLTNKTDLLPPDAAAHLRRWEERTGLRPIATSALTGRGLEEFRSAVADLPDLSGAGGGEMLGLHRRQRRSMGGAAEAAARGADILRGAAEVSDAADLVAIELREALAELGQVSGQIVTEEILGRILARFCVGK